MPKNILPQQKSSELETVLEQVRGDFVQRLHSQLPQIKSIRQRIHLPNRDSDFEIVEFMAHRTCGIAKTVGYADLGATAQKLEEAVSKDRLQNCEQDVSRISTLLDELISEMRSVCSNPNSGLTNEC
jgi:HPt (histidine-containing phosphotransfer) domain-containing protein